jgi:ABC-type cobalamin/Fe3+-siderophores transport system ATPase subunit
MSIVMVSHVLNEVAHYAQQVAVVEGGAVVAGPVAEVVTTERLSDLYGLEVQVAEVAGRRVVVPGRTR